MSRRLPVLPILFLAAISAAWGADERRAVLFINSSPILAEVTLQGRPVGRTPLLLKDLAPGRYILKVALDGYSGGSRDLFLEPGETRVLDLPLVASGIHSVFPEDPLIVIAGRVEESTGRVFILEQGRFTVQREEGTTYLDPLYPQQRLIDALNLSIPLMLLFSGVLTVDALANPPEPRRALPPAVLAAHGVTLSMIGLDIALNLSKRKQLPSYRYAARPQEDFAKDAWRIYREGERLLAQGDLEQARAEYGRILRSSGSSSALPWAVFRTADILYLEGKHEAAAREYARMMRDYPIAALYDRSCKNLADLHFRREQYGESLRCLSEMVFRDPVFTREEVDFYRCEILESWARRDPTVRTRLIRQLTEFTERYPRSVNLELGRRKLAEWSEAAL